VPCFIEMLIIDKFKYIFLLFIITKISCNKEETASVTKPEIEEIIKGREIKPSSACWRLKTQTCHSH
jgi:hypothetical protein